MLDLASRSFSYVPPVSFILSFFYTPEGCFCEEEQSNNWPKQQPEHKKLKKHETNRQTNKRGGDICIRKNRVVLVDEMCAGLHIVILSSLTVM